MPLKNQLHVNELLSNVSVKYKNEEYIWDKAVPQVMVAKDTDLYRIYDRMFKVPETKRAPKALANEAGFEVSTASFSLETHAIKDYVGDDEAQNYDQSSLEVDATENLTDIIHRRLELNFSNIMTLSSWSLNVSLAATAIWSANTTVSDPVPVVDTGTTTIIHNSGKKSNSMILPRDGFVACKSHISILDRIKYTSSEVGEAILASLFGVKNLYVPASVQDTAANGIAASISPFFSDFAFLYWKPDNPGLRVPSPFYNFMNGLPKVRKWRDEERKATAIEVEVKSQFRVVASLTGYFIRNTV